MRTAEPLVCASIRKIIDDRGLVNVRSLAREYFFSDRQFERKFKEFSGFSPKLYARINRFQAAPKQYGSGKTLTSIAYDCGYYDQSHFINDFKEFSGYNPKVYFTGQAEGSEYLEADFVVFQFFSIGPFIFKLMENAILEREKYEYSEGHQG